jgi:signal transduction histidine kinase
MLKIRHSECVESSIPPWSDAESLLCAQPEIHAEVVALRDRVEALQATLDGADEWALVWSVGGAVVPCSARARQKWEQVAPHEKDALCAWIAQVLASGEEMAECSLEWTHSGRRVMHVRCLPQQEDANAQAASCRVYLRDVTLPHDIDRMKSEFLSAAAHELRTPLASIFGFAELMLVRQLAPEKQHELLGTIHRQSQSLIDLINELLDLSRIEARRGKDLLMVPVPVSTLVQRTLAGWHYRADVHTLDCNLSQGEHVVLADADKTRQALLNVLSNAVKYSPRGGRIEVRTLLRHRTEGSQVGIRVSDEGIGMTPAQCARAFERFYRAEPLGDIPGTGLGLSLVREIMQIQGGEVCLVSAEGEGTQVTLWLPLHGTSGVH